MEAVPALLVLPPFLVKLTFTSIAEVYRKMGISEATSYKWKKSRAA